MGIFQPDTSVTPFADLKDECHEKVAEHIKWVEENDPDTPVQELEIVDIVLDTVWDKIQELEEQISDGS